MRVATFSALLLGIGFATPAEARKVFIVTDPMTLERRTIVIESGGPERFYLCTLPPATSGCLEVPRRRR